MPTESNKNILDTESYKETAQPMIDLASTVLREAVNHASTLYERCRVTKKADNDESYPVLALFLHIIQMMDSVEILISNCCVESANVLVRSAFEAALGLEYMCETSTRTRGLAWILRNILDRIEYGERHNKSTKKGKEFYETLEREGLGGMPELPEDYNSNLKKALEKPEYVDLYEEYKRLKKKLRRVEWYSLYDGPTNIRELAEHLGQKSIYDSLYRSWSQQVHAASSDHLHLLFEDGQSVLGPIRNPLNIAHVSSYALGLILTADQTMVKRFLSGHMKSFSRWYRTEISQKHLALVKGEKEHLKWFENTFMKKQE